MAIELSSNLLSTGQTSDLNAYIDFKARESRLTSVDPTTMMSFELSSPRER